MTRLRFLTLIAAASSITMAIPVHAADSIAFDAQVDRSQISMDDSVALKFSIRSDDGTLSGAEAPQFSAPDFEVINEYNGTFVESVYENGQFKTRQKQEITKVLKPKKLGSLKITGLQVQVGGRTYTAPPIGVQVQGGGAGTPPPRGYGGGGVGLRGSGKPANTRGAFVRAEVDKVRAHKGEQIIVSYYIYRRPNFQVFNLQADKYPTLSGFLREDLEMPIQGTRLDKDDVVLDGVPYQRSLLLRYAAYPLKEGKLSIDQLAVKFNYYGARRGGTGLGDDEDPIYNFFQQMAPQAGSSQSDVLTIDVLPLPEGKPANFSGGVGEFSLVSVVDKYEVHAGEALTLTVKVEGKGNLTSIDTPKATWPPSVELYDSKGQAKTGRGGMGEKIFEYLLIPREPGKLTLPPIELSYFDPGKNEYVTQKSEPIEINVLAPLPGAAPMSPKRLGQGSGNPSSTPAGGARTEEVRPLKPLEESGQSAALSVYGQPAWRWLYWLSVLGFAAFVGVVLNDFVRRKRAGPSDAERAEQRLREEKSWQHLLELSARTDITQLQLNEGYERLAGALYDAIDRKFHLGSRSIARSELGQILTDEKGLDPALWRRIDQVLEFTEMVRFASNAGAVSQGSVRADLRKWVEEGQLIDRALI